MLVTIMIREDINLMMRLKTTLKNTNHIIILHSTTILQHVKDQVSKQFTLVCSSWQTTKFFHNLHGRTDYLMEGKIHYLNYQFMQTLTI